MWMLLSSHSMRVCSRGFVCSWYNYEYDCRVAITLFAFMTNVVVALSLSFATICSLKLLCMAFAPPGVLLSKVVSRIVLTYSVRFILDCSHKRCLWRCLCRDSFSCLATCCLQPFVVLVLGANTSSIFVKLVSVGDMPAII